MWKKVLIGFVIFILFFVCILALVPLIFKDKLMTIARKLMNS